MNPVEWLEHVPERYRIDRRELGKVMIVASTALLFLSVHSIMVFDTAMEDVEAAENNLKEADAIMSSSGFNDSMEAIQSMSTYEEVDIYNQFRQAAAAFSSAGDSLDRVSDARERMEDNFHMYQWLVLISIMGEVAGIAVIYI